MTRRAFIALLGGAAAAVPFAAKGEDGERRVGIISGFVEADRSQQVKAFKQSLAERGWLEGQNLRIDYRSADGDASRLPALADELAAPKPNAIFAMATPALVAMRQVTRTIPIVFASVSDPVDGGFVESMAHPGGNITGFTSFEYSLGGKWLQTLKEVSPGLARVMVLLNPDNYTSRALLRTVEDAAPSLGLSVMASHVRGAADIEPAIRGFAAEPNGGMIVLPDPATTVPIAQIISLALLHRLPTVHALRFFPANGGLMSYGPDDIDIYRRAGEYVDRILRGANVGELPVQNPTKYQLVINMKTARALGLKVPDHVIALAEEVIE
jgi:putative ABC transport system substrate-binding protein